MKRPFHHVMAVIRALALVILCAGQAAADRRVALVVGNSAYRNGAPLPNTVNDSTAIAQLFRAAGFDVVDSRRDLGSLDFKRAVREFMSETRNADVAVVYYAGHGIEVDGTNYLVPVDAKLASDFDAEDEAVSLDRIIRSIEPARRLRLVILDACRDNPFVTTMKRAVALRAVPSGLAKIEPAVSDTLIAYAAKAGSVSYDGGGPNSPFTTALLKHIAEPGLDIRLALGRVRDEVVRVTANKQEPFVYGSLGGATVSLVPAAASKDAEPPAPPASGGPSGDMRRDYEFAERIGTRTAWEAFLAAHPSGFYANLARAQVAKLGPAAVDSTSRAEPPRVQERDTVGRDNARAKAEADRQQRERDAAARTEAEQLRLEREAALKAHDERLRLEREAALKAQSAPPTAEQACKRDEERLTRLRASRDRDEVLRFERELACERLRPQVVRLRESVASD
ncbi:MAG TPA: caspase family protein [Xanthobacteraceae bacterium]|nr:caspase family protein [Xanthobacteraceae bacterium]